MKTDGRAQPNKGAYLETDSDSHSSQVERLIRPRHFDASVEKMCSELAHGVFFAVNKKRTLCTGLLLPSQQFRLVGVGGKAIDRVDARPNRNIFAEDVHLRGAVDNLACKRPNGCVADEHDARILPTEIVLEGVAHAAAGAHAQAGHDDGPAMDTVDRDGLGGFTREMQSWQGKRVVSLLKQLRDRRLKAFRMA